MFEDILLQSLVLLPLILSVYFSFFVLRLTDLSIEGSFAVGAGIYSRAILGEVDAFMAFALALIGGFLIGGFLGVIQYRERIPTIIAGILVGFLLFSLNLKIMGQPNISLLDRNTISSAVGNFLQLPDPLRESLIMVLVTGILLGFFIMLKSNFGTLFRAFGCNSRCLDAFGYRSELIKICGLGISHLLAASSGCLMAEINGYADHLMGIGTLMVGVAIVMLASQLALTLSRKQDPSLPMDLSCLVLSSVAYFSLLAFFIEISDDPLNVKLFCSVTMIILLLAVGKDRRFVRGFNR